MFIGVCSTIRYFGCFHLDSEPQPQTSQLWLNQSHAYSHVFVSLSVHGNSQLLIILKVCWGLSWFVMLQSGCDSDDKTGRWPHTHTHVETRRKKWFCVWHVPNTGSRVLEHFHERDKKNSNVTFCWICIQPFSEEAEGAWDQAEVVSLKNMRAYRSLCFHHCVLTKALWGLLTFTITALWCSSNRCFGIYFPSAAVLIRPWGAVLPGIQYQLNTCEQ